MELITNNKSITAEFHLAEPDPDREYGMDYARTTNGMGPLFDSLVLYL